jgi:serine/threonine protein phosphatase 1
VGASTHVARLDPDSVVLAVGDIHGRLDLLEGATRELRRAAADGATRGVATTVIFLGDYIDRGPRSAGVLSHLIGLRDEPPCEIHFLRGNHEQFLLDLIDGHAEGTTWLDYGGVETLASYGIQWPPAGGYRGREQLAEAVRAAIPQAHVQFLRDTEQCVERGDYFFVHAGLRPDRLLSEQTDADLLWFRYYSDEEPVHGKTVVHGHTPRGRPVAGRWRIGIDTEAYASDALTIARIEGAQVRFLKVGIESPGAEATITDWAAIDQPRDRSEAAIPNSASRRPQPVLSRRRGMIAVGAAAALLFVGLVVGVAWRLGDQFSPPPAHLQRAPGK